MITLVSAGQFVSAKEEAQAASTELGETHARMLDLALADETHAAQLLSSQRAQVEAER